MTDPDLAPFQEALARGEIVVQHCGGCGAVRWPPRPACPKCRSFESDWRPVPTTGTVYSWVVLHTAAAPSIEPRLPMPVAIVELQPGVRLLGRVDSDPEAIAIGMSVEASFETGADGETLIAWKPV